jgi:hypothetical protein
MLAEQELVSQETRDLENKKPAAKEPSPAASGAVQPRLSADAYAEECRSLARRERVLHTDAGELIELLGEDDAAVVAPEILRRVQDDLENAAARLDASETAELTQLLQRDVETALRELIEALESSRRAAAARRGSGASPPPGTPGSPRQRRDLITPVMEIRMLLSAQRRLRARTERLEALGVLPETGPPGQENADTKESPTPEALRAEQASRLAKAQEALAGLADDIIRKYPEIDQLLLGLDNDAVNDGESTGPTQEERKPSAEGKPDGSPHE